MSAGQEYKNVTIVLRIFDVKTETMEKEVTKTIDEHQRRVWITKTIMWAVMNKKYVEVVNKEDD